MLVSTHVSIYKKASVMSSDQKKTQHKHYKDTTRDMLIMDQVERIVSTTRLLLAAA
jgi:hypothetical protein